jgi:hypothetical protein
LINTNGKHPISTNEEPGILDLIFDVKTSFPFLYTQKRKALLKDDAVRQG